VKDLVDLKCFKVFLTKVHSEKNKGIDNINSNSISVPFVFYEYIERRVLHDLQLVKCSLTNYNHTD